MTINFTPVMLFVNPDFRLALRIMNVELVLRDMLGWPAYNVVGKWFRHQDSLVPGYRTEAATSLSFNVLTLDNG